MKTYTAIFREHLIQKMRALNIRQVDLVREVGIGQPHLSKILKRNSEIKVSTMCALWPFVYGSQFPMPEAPLIPASAHTTAQENSHE